MDRKNAKNVYPVSVGRRGSLKERIRTEQVTGKERSINVRATDV